MDKMINTNVKCNWSLVLLSALGFEPSNLSNTHFIAIFSDFKLVAHSS